MRILLYAPVDLNLIDGSAIWCASVAEMLTQDEDVRVDILLHAPLKRNINTARLERCGRISLLNPWRPEESGAFGTPNIRLGARLTPDQAFELIQNMQRRIPRDLLILRGGGICRRVSETPALASRSWFYLTQYGTDTETLTAISRSNARIACQTPLVQAYLEGMLGTGPGRYVPLPPMVPRLLTDAPPTARRGRILSYVGKFEAHYMVEEMIAEFARVRSKFADAELVVAGDKFHDPERTGEFETRVRAALENTAGVSWRGALPREAVGELMKSCDVGCCWRSAHYDDSLELSTKALEYAAAGAPVILNPSRVNRLVFGDDYPLFVDSPESFRNRVCELLDDDELYCRAARAAFETCIGHTFAEVSRTLQVHLAAYRNRATGAAIASNRPRRILFVGHDLKFCQDVIRRLEQRPDCLTRIDRWRNHTQHDERRSEELLRWADVIWCEWCLGNAVWCSRRVRPGQLLVTRLHRQEITTDYPGQVRWPNVGKIVFIAAHVRDALREQLGPDTLPESYLIYNTVDCQSFAREKPPGAEFRLGLLGYCPKLKNPRLAVEILERLTSRDDRWRLSLAGHPPEHYAWLWHRPEEREYYERLEDYIRTNGLDKYIERTDWTDDPAAWFADVGLIVSSSDLEGSHQAVAEGMAAGCVPVVRRWRGAAAMYPNALLFDDSDEAAEKILAHIEPRRWAAYGDAARREAGERFDTSVILPKLERLLLGDATNEPPAAGVPAAIQE